MKDRQRGLDYGFPASMKAPSNAPPFEAGVTPACWKASALITIWATLKLPQCSRLIELRESADGLRWAIGRAGAMAVIWVQIAKTAGRVVGRTGPDVHLIKQVEQVTISALEGPAWRFARISSMWVTAAAEILVCLIWQLPHWLLCGCKNSQTRRGDLFAKGQSGNAAGPDRRFHEPGHMGCRAVALPNSVRLIHNLVNLACCLDFKVSHHRPFSLDPFSAIRG
jgi:hypothetical protein